MVYKKIVHTPLDRKKHSDRPTTVRPAYSFEPSEKTWALQSKSGTTAGRVINISKGTMIIGRNASCDIILDNEMVSSQHAQLQSADGTVKLKDLDSTNGTYVNGKKISESQLFDGDDVSFDMASFTVKKLSLPPSQNKVKSAISFDKSSIRPAPGPDMPELEQKPDQSPCKSNASIEIIKGRSNKSCYNLDRGTSIFGRLGDSDIVLQDEAVSNFHALLSRITGQWILEDYGSANGTYINNVQITRQALKDGDIISLGHAVMRFHNPDSQSDVAGTQGSVEKSVHEQGPISKGKMVLPLIIWALVSFIGIAIFL
ncbi:MAG: FHA domain-containing protein [Desulfobacteraceae bacterium]|jgi:pSer/pThr/pTyr-binding forkhead associated (FHA) protein